MRGRRHGFRLATVESSSWRFWKGCSTRQCLTSLTLRDLNIWRAQLMLSWCRAHVDINIFARDSEHKPEREKYPITSQSRNYSFFYDRTKNSLATVRWVVLTRYHACGQKELDVRRKLIVCLNYGTCNDTSSGHRVISEGKLEHCVNGNDFFLRPSVGVWKNQRPHWFPV